MTGRMNSSSTEYNDPSGRWTDGDITGDLVLRSNIPVGGSPGSSPDSEAGTVMITSTNTQGRMAVSNPGTLECLSTPTSLGPMAHSTPSGIPRPSETTRITQPTLTIINQVMPAHKEQSSFPNRPASTLKPHTTRDMPGKYSSKTFRVRISWKISLAVVGLAVVSYSVWGIVGEIKLLLLTLGRSFAAITSFGRYFGRDGCAVLEFGCSPLPT
ncbi:hypothetical protein C8R47DRAFT_574787 [Mycena vitilis]|nr:hypothetical protein C8R47DRAFT_574787 [Mycena vitilis]